MSAVVVLGHNLSREFSKEIMSNRLNKALGLLKPSDTLVLVGGNPDGGGIESHWMRERVNCSNVLVEEDSKDTLENALFSIHMMTNNGIKTFKLVTSDWHAFRANKIFECIVGAVENDQINFEGCFASVSTGLHEDWLERERDKELRIINNML